MEKKTARSKSRYPALGRVRRNTKGRSWCGPSALTVITGYSYQECRDAIAAETGKRSVTRVGSGPMRRALQQLRPDLILVPSVLPGTLPTLAQYLDSTRTFRSLSTYYLLQLTGHFVVIRGRKLWDNRTPEKGVFLGTAPHRRRRVHAAWKLVGEQPRSTHHTLGGS